MKRIATIIGLAAMTALGAANAETVTVASSKHGYGHGGYHGGGHYGHDRDRRPGHHYGHGYGNDYRSHSLEGSAHRLHSAAETLYRNIYHVGSNRDGIRISRDFLAQAEKFLWKVKHQGDYRRHDRYDRYGRHDRRRDSRYGLEREYDDLVRCFYRLKKEIGHGRRAPSVSHGFQQVAWAMSNLESSWGYRYSRYGVSQLEVPRGSIGLTFRSK